MVPAVCGGKDFIVKVGFEHGVEKGRNMAYGRR